MTTNLEFLRWGEMLPGIALTSALIDRFTRHSHILNMSAESYFRKQEAQPHPTL